MDEKKRINKVGPWHEDQLFHQTEFFISHLLMILGEMIRKNI